MIRSICLVFQSSRFLYVLLYADNLALVASSPEGLQAQLYLLHAYTAEWKLAVNIDKTKAVVFWQTSTNQVYPPPIYNGASIEFAESFKYLEVELHCTRQFASAALPRFETGVRSQFTLFLSLHWAWY